MAPPPLPDSDSTTAAGPLAAHKSYVPDGLLLFELSHDVESDLRTGKRVCIKGVDNAVLCTESQTFEIKRVETSNTCLLVELNDTNTNTDTNTELNSKPQTSVRSSSSCHYELVPQNPHIDLTPYLEESAQRVTAPDEDVDMNNDAKLPGMTLAELETKVPASIAEIKASLSRCHAVELESGRWCCLGAAERIPLFNAVLTACIANNWHASRLDVREVSTQVPELQCNDVLRLVLGPYGKVLSQEGHEAWQLDSEKVARFRARQILELMHNNDISGKGVPEDQFRTTWKISLPDGVEGSVLDLTGLGVKEPVPGQASDMSLLRFFPVDEMPADAKTSFIKIFRFRAQWPLEELQIYINHLIGPSVTLAALLKRYTRACRDTNGRVVHSAR